MPVTLGLAGDLIAGETGFSPLDWRVGGLVTLPAAISFEDSNLICYACGQRLSLVAQVHACEDDCFGQ